MQFNQVMSDAGGIHTADPGTAVLNTAEGDTADECSNCKATQEQYAYLKDRLKKQSLTIDNLLSDRALNPEAREDPFLQSDLPQDGVTAPPMDLGKCHQIIRGMRLLIIDKDAEINHLSKGHNRIIPAEFKKELNDLRD